MSAPDRKDSADQPDQLAEFQAELREVERTVAGRIDPGPKAMLIAVAVLALLVSAVLPWVGEVSGWQVLLGQASPELRIGILPRIFAGILVFVVLMSAATLALRRWGLSWLCALGSALGLVTAMLAVWSRQTAVNLPGPGVGLAVAGGALVVLAIQWFRVAWSRP